jgi:hypothetical protein
MPGKKVFRILKVSGARLPDIFNGGKNGIRY